MLNRIERLLVRCAASAAGRTSTGMRLGRRYGFGSGLALDHVCGGTAQGALGVGRVIDRALLAGRDSRAVRSRDAILRQILREEVAVRGGEIRVLDLVAGPGRRLQDLLTEDQPGGQLRVVCRDAEPAAIEQGQRMARQRRLTEEVRFEQGDPLDPAPPYGGLGTDIVIASGFYESLPEDDVLRESLERLRSMLTPDGTLLFSTRTACAGRELLTDVLPRRDRAVRERSCRPVAEAEAWAVKAGFTAEGMTSRTEPEGLYAVTRCRTA